MLQFSQGKTAKTDLPLKVWGASGFRTAQRPIVWSGRGGGNKFFLYKKHQWMPLTNMTTPRNYASALQINPNQALIIGGSDVQTWMMFSSRNYLKSTETVSSSGAEKGKDFSDDIYGHCSFKINAIYGWVISGYWLYFDATRQRIKIAQETRSKAAIRKKCLRNWIQDWVMLQFISQNLLISAVEQ